MTRVSCGLVVLLTAFAVAAPAHAARVWVGPETFGPFKTSTRLADVAADGTTVTAWSRSPTFADHYFFSPELNVRVSGGAEVDIGQSAGPVVVAAGRGGQALVAWSELGPGGYGTGAAHVSFAPFTNSEVIGEGSTVAADMNDSGAAAIAVGDQLLYRPPGGTFGPPVTLPAAVQQVSMTPTGEAVVVTSENLSTAIVTRTADGPLSAPHAVPSSSGQRIQTVGDAHGNLLVSSSVGADGTFQERFADGTWGPVTAVGSSPSVAADERGDALVASVASFGAVQAITGDLATGTFSAPVTLGQRVGGVQAAMGADGTAQIAALGASELLSARRDGLGPFGPFSVVDCQPLVGEPFVTDDGVARLFDGTGLVHDAPAARPRPRSCTPPTAGVGSLTTPKLPAPGQPVRIDLRSLREPGLRVVHYAATFSDGGAAIPTGTPGVFRHTFPRRGEIPWHAELVEAPPYSDARHTLVRHFKASVTPPLRLTVASVRAGQLTVRAAAHTAVEAVPVTLTARAGDRVLSHRSLLLGPEPTPVRLDLGRHPPGTVTVTLRQAGVHIARTVRVR